MAAAQARSALPHESVVADGTTPAAAFQTRVLWESHRPDSPSRLSTIPASPRSQDTIESLHHTPPLDQNRKSIIDPTTIRLSFVGSISDLSQPLATPLLQGLQKLYQLYQDHAPSPTPLPYDVQITDVPLTTIAESLESHIQEQNSILRDCAEDVRRLNLAHDKAKQDLVDLELRYSIAREEAGLRSMTTDDFRQRFEWMRDEIGRVNAEKETALQENIDQMREKDRLRKELVDVLDVRLEIQKLKEANLIHEHKQNKLKRELEVTKRKLKETEFALRSVPSPIQKICAKVLVSDQDKGKAKKTPSSTEQEVSPPIVRFY